MVRRLRRASSAWRRKLARSVRATTASPCVRAASGAPSNAPTHTDAAGRRCRLQPGLVRLSGYRRAASSPAPRLRAVRRICAWNRSNTSPPSPKTRPGFVQNCPTPIVTDVRSPSAIFGAALAHRLRQDEHRIDAAHLCEDRNRIGRASRVEQRAAGGERAGEPGRTCERMADECHADDLAGRRAASRRRRPADRTRQRRDRWRRRRARPCPDVRCAL